MHPSAVAMACALQVGARTIELHVLRDNPVWRWEMRFAGGQTLDAGAATTRFAAKVAAQRAFEFRMKRSGLYKRGFAGYRWE